jgi:hypothetical protein
LDWEKAAKQEIVRARGADPVEPAYAGRAAWMKNADREALLSAGWTPGPVGSLMQSDARALLRLLRGIGVKPEDISRVRAIADPAARGKKAAQLRATLREGESRALAGTLEPIASELKRTIEGLLADLGWAEKRGPSTVKPGPQPTVRLAKMKKSEIASMRERRRRRGTT